VLFPQELRERVLRGKYRVPFYMSTDCEGILRRFLVLNPTKRCTLEVRRSNCDPQSTNTANDLLSLHRLCDLRLTLYLIFCSSLSANNEG